MAKKMGQQANGGHQIPIDSETTSKGPERHVDVHGGVQIESVRPSGLVAGRKLPVIMGRQWPMWLEHGGDWEIFEHREGDRKGDLEFLPVVGPLILRPGSNQVIQPKTRGQKIGTGRILNQYRDEWGHVVFTNTDDFLRVVQETSTGEPAYHLKWESFRVYGDGTTEANFDREGFADWRRQQVIDGKIPPPRDGVIRQLTRRLERRKGRISQDIHTPKAKRQMEEAERRADALPGIAAEAQALPGNVGAGV